MLYTRTGDGGTSGVFGTCDRMSKDSPVFIALGSLDELNSLLGVCRACARKNPSAAYDVEAELLRTQEGLFMAQAELAGADKHIAQSHVDDVESSIAELEKLITNPHSFVIPGANELSAHLDYARAVARRAERSVVTLHGEHVVPAPLRIYMNRLSSLLYALARYTAACSDAPELSPSYGKLHD